MKLIYQHHEGSQDTMPLTIDTESSKLFVYLRKNIELITKKDPMSNEDISMWSYDEATISIEDYEKYKSEAALELGASVTEDNLVLMEAVASNFEQTLSSVENQLTIMDAIADLYMMIAEKEV